MNDSDLKARVLRLERQLNMQRLLTASFIIAALAVAGIAATNSPAVDELRAKRLVIVNDQGENAVLLTSEKAGGVVALFSGDGRIPTLIAGGRPEGAELLLKSSGGQNSVQISSSKTGGQVLVSVEGTLRPITGQSSK